ncbi:MAG: cysteine desulfurase [Pyrinomonadaceae bacterium MAG19_C2-C3]|nr:cysteine desulfurase [Pyrinomonadaceae bacterium MAG19_C2-C3]
MKRRVYLDYSSTTPVDERVVAAMLPFLTNKFGNASSVHSFGQEARAAVDRARAQVADVINARPNDIVFLSGGTEANNLAVRGVCEMNEARGRHIITSAIEHSAVREVCDAMERHAWTVTRLPVYNNGIVRLEDVRAALRPDTVLITVMLANNEIGTLQPIEEIGAFVRETRAGGHRHLWLHTDAVQAVGRMNIDVENLGCDLLSMSGHKLYAPKGVGGLYVRRGVRLARQNIGGHQERERRGGTESVAGIVAFGAAAELARTELDARITHLLLLRNRFEAEVVRLIPDVIFNGDRKHRLPHLSNISFDGIEGDGLLINLDLNGIAVSTGSACASGSIEPSHVLRALGLTDQLARAAIRFSLGKDTTDEDVDYVLEVLPRAVKSLRDMSPTYQKRLSHAVI